MLSVVPFHCWVQMQILLESFGSNIWPSLYVWPSTSQLLRFAISSVPVTDHSCLKACTYLSAGLTFEISRYLGFFFLIFCFFYYYGKLPNISTFTAFPHNFRQESLRKPYCPVQNWTSGKQSYEYVLSPVESDKIRLRIYKAQQTCTI